MGDHPADPRPNISLYAESDPAWGDAWPHAFQAVYTVCLCEPDPPEPDLAAMAAEAFGGDVTAMEPGGYGEDEGQQPGSGGGRGRRGFTLQRPSGKDAEGTEDEEGSSVDAPAASQLRCILAVHNSGDAPFTFTAGLRPHFATEDIGTHGRFVKSLGLWGEPDCRASPAFA